MDAIHLPVGLTLPSAFGAPATPLQVGQVIQALVLELIESDAAKRLFCRGSYAVGTTEPETATPVADASAKIGVTANDAVTTASTTIKASAPAEPMLVTVPLPVARPSSLRR